MSKSLVVFQKIKEKTKESLFEKIDQACDQTQWFTTISPNSIFIKINGMSSELIPGVSTSPWVFEASLCHIRKHFPKSKIYFGDSDGYGVKQVDKMVKNWGLLNIAKKYNAEFVNLTKDQKEMTYLGPILNNQILPKTLTDIDCIINIPVGKTHGLSIMTASMKNLWGLLPETRYRFHPVIHDAIAEINEFFKKIALNICDMTITMDGTGPRCGDRKICDVIMISTDRVALDATVAKYMGFDPNHIPYIQNAAKMNVGSLDFEIVGDPFETEQFRPCIGSEHFLYRWRDRIQKVPVLNSLIFNTKLYFFPVKFAEIYNKKIFYLTKGKKILKWIKTETWYKKEYENLG